MAAGMVDYGRYRYILVNKDDGVATVTLNRPERLNAVDTEFHSELEDLSVDTSLFLEAATMETQDLREAAKAFLEKRPPRFRGA
jgi:enoyl-CoA hydratase/carnithine racemase